MRNILLGIFVALGIVAGFVVAAAPTFLGTVGPSVNSNRIVPGGTASLSKTDCNTIIDFTSNSPVMVTVPSNLPFNCVVSGEQLGVGPVSFVGPISSVSNATKSAGQFAMFGVRVHSNVGGSAAKITLFGEVIP
jgi:hypothetical protein